MMVKKYSRSNFFKHTFCEFQARPLAEVQHRIPNYSSASGSTYYFDDLGVYRLSNHWGRAANCRWRLVGSSSQESCKLGYALWTDFFPNNDSDALFYIEYNAQTSKANFQHRQRALVGSAVLQFRTASETAKLLKIIQEISTSTAWAKHLEYSDIAVLRSEIIQQFISTNLSWADIKRKYIYGTQK